MHAGRPVKQRRLLGVSVALVVACCVVILPLWNAIIQSPELSELEAAEGRWDSRAFTSYTLTIVYADALGRCSQRVEVSGQQVVQVLDDNCNSQQERSPVSVNGLFNMLRSNLAPGLCTDAVCRCLTTYRVNPVYDGNLGYPLIVLMVPRQTGATPASNVYLEPASDPAQRLGCDLIAPGSYETLSVTDLHPLN